MKIMVVGGGGREHALCWALAASPLVTEVICAPGNGGICRDWRCLEIAADDVEGLVRAAVDERAELVVVGPEQPLVLGLIDRLQDEGVRAFGPRAAAARLEGSKAFTKEFCARHFIPTAAARAFGAEQAEAAHAYLAGHALPVVVKADGLAAGKGVTVASTRAEAQMALDAAFAGAFGAAGATVLIEECLLGEEASLFALSDGRHVLELGTAQDHKRVGEGDTGPNTGGMGAFSPAPVLTPELTARAMDEIVRPAVRGMEQEGTPFAGVLYAGLMLTDDGPKLIEFNVRFGDPECQAVLPRLMTDLGQLLLGAADGMLGHMDVRWYSQHALSVVLAARGYPGAFAKGSLIKGVDEAAAESDVLVFHAGTARTPDGTLTAAGGRVLNVTGLGPDLRAARERAYAGIERIDWPEGFCRRDIGWRALDVGAPERL